jgi:hypothetical protein
MHGLHVLADAALDQGLEGRGCGIGSHAFDSVRFG